MTANLLALKSQLQGELHLDKAWRTIYATDASAYREMPLAVAIPKNKQDIKNLILFAQQNKTSLIPRTAGTSLAGQVVGKGIVVDTSKHFTKIIELNQKEQWVKVQTGVIRDELNMYLKDFGLFFGPETSTANRAMIGGMVGNNSCGSNSIQYGSVREHLLEVTAFLADGSEVVFKALTPDEFKAKCRGENVVSPLEQSIYQNIYEILSNKENQNEIRKEFPKPNIPRRNTGYALDMLLETEIFSDTQEAFNFCKLIAGSEGTLAFITEIKLHLDKMPPKHSALLCIHCQSINESLKANLVAIKYNPFASELIDNYILECTKNNAEQRQNRFFVQGEPQAILVVEIKADEKNEVEQTLGKLIDELKSLNLGYHYPVLWGEDTKKIWNLRKAGLGLLSNMVGDAKPVPVIEDTAVDVQDLPAYIAEFNEILKKYGLFSVHYAHAGSGELHLRPIINLKTQEGNQLFRTIALEVAHLVKKYKASLSGEHGDGRLRGEFIGMMIGQKNYELLKLLKNTWDAHNIFNPEKIVDTPPMNTQLRYQPNQATKEIPTVLNFDSTLGILRAAEQCNGSGDCRKTELSGGTMCPSYMATKNEKDTTRARANILREFLTNSTKQNPFDHKEIYEVMDLCLSCKGCKAECPSNVDVGKMKAEFLHHYYQANGVPFRTKMISNYSFNQKLAAISPKIYNFLVSNNFTSSIFKDIMGFAPKRKIPRLHNTTLRNWFKKNSTKASFSQEKSLGKVWLFCDEFTNYNDTPIGIKAVELLQKLNYEVQIPIHLESGRTFLSKGMLNEAREIAIRNVELLKDLVSEQTPLLGVEPSAILSFRDEYLDLVPDYLKESAQKIAAHCFLFDEFIAKEREKGNIKSEQFKNDKRLIKLHGHCHQKALSSLVATKKMLTLPSNYEVQIIPSGCCGMAGSFGYESEHYEVSMKVGELVLFPTIRQQPENVIIVASGTSCRHQIEDGTGRKAQHALEVLLEALK